MRGWRSLNARSRPIKPTWPCGPGWVGVCDPVIGLICLSKNVGNGRNNRKAKAQEMRWRRHTSTSTLTYRHSNSRHQQFTPIRIIIFVRDFKALIFVCRGCCRWRCSCEAGLRGTKGQSAEEWVTNSVGEGGRDVDQNMWQNEEVNTNLLFPSPSIPSPFVLFPSSQPFSSLFFLLL